MKQFIDKYGRIHDKVVTPDNPIPSNNGWIYSAYADLLGVPLDLIKLQNCFDQCKRSSYPLVVDRSPGSIFPAMSRDEILGMVHLGFLRIDDLKKSHWQFCNLDGFVPVKFSRISWLTLIKAAWNIRSLHRNSLWNERSLWPLGFRLPFQDIWFVKMKSAHSPGWPLTLFFYLSSFMTLMKQDASSLLILWMKLHSLGLSDHFIAKKIKIGAVAKEYFGDDHPLSIRAQLIKTSNES